MTQRDHTHSLPVRLPPYPSVIHALTLLLQAYRDAQDNRQPVWEYAIEINCFLDARVPSSTLRSLIDKGIVEHRYELHPARHGQRRFGHAPSHVFKSKSAFMLAGQAVSFIGDFLLQAGSTEKMQPLNGVADNNAAFGGPLWLPKSGELWLENDLVKIIPAKAQNQRKVLDAGINNAWRQPIPNPFVISGDRVDPDALHNALDRLNRGQINQRLHFHRDGSGRGWGFIMIGPPTVGESRSQLHRR